MKKLLLILKEDLLDKKWFLLGLGVLVGLLSCYVVYLISTWDLSSLQAYLQSLPESYRALLGQPDVANPYSFLNGFFFSFLWLYCGVFIIYLASNLVPQEVENNTLDLVLSKPVSRERYLTGKIIFLYVFTAILMSLVIFLTAVAMGASSVFVEEGLHWERLWAVFLAANLHLGTLTMTAVFFSTVSLSTKKTMGAAVVTMFLMYFIGGAYGAVGSTTNPLQPLSTWSYYNPTQFFGAGNFGNFLSDMLILLSINVGLIIASIIVFKKRDIPV